MTDNLLIVPPGTGAGGLQKRDRRGEADGAAAGGPAGGRSDSGSYVDSALPANAS